MSGAVNVCTAPGDMPRIDEGPYRTAALVLTIVIPILLFMQFAVYVNQRKYYVFLRKRSLSNVTMLFIAAYMTWGFTVLYDYVGAQAYPCWLFHFLNYASAPLMACCILLQISMYLSEIGVLRLRRRLKEVGDEEAMENLRVLDSQGTLDASTALRALLAHLRLILGLHVRKEYRFQERMLNVQFARSVYFKIFWLSISCVPFLIVYFVRLGTDPQLTQCNGCEMSSFDAAFTMSMFALGSVVGEAGLSSRVSRVDALRILREAKIAWRISALPLIAYSLYLADPGGLYASHTFNWRMIFMLEVLMLCYLKSTHQVLLARSLKRKLLLSNFLAREDRFEDVQKSKQLRALFRTHLDSELSSEIYHFMDDVEELRASWEREKEGRQARARQVFDTYIQRRSPREVNLSYPVREQLLTDFTKGNVDITCFDAAYAEIKLHLINDGFARYLSKLSSTLIQEERHRARQTFSTKSITELRKKRLTDLLTLSSSPTASSISLVS